MGFPCFNERYKDYGYSFDSFRYSGFRSHFIFNPKWLHASPVEDRAA